MSLRALIPGGATTLYVALGVGVITLGIVRGSSSVSSYFELTKSREVLSQTVTSLRQENGALATEIERIRTSPSYAKKCFATNTTSLSPTRASSFLLTNR